MNNKPLLTHAYFLSSDEREQSIMKPYAPLGILYIAAWLRKNGTDCDVYDSTFSTFEKLKSYIDENAPPVIGIYTNLMTRVNVIKIIKYLRSKPIAHQPKIILGGPEVRYHAAELLKVGADVIVIGEGEQTMLELCNHFIQGESSLGNITGIAYSNAGEIKNTPEREKFKSLDVLPHPARDKIDIQLYLDAWKNRHGENSISINTMRGCPYTCKWCSRAVYGQSYRRRSPQHVIDELQFLQKQYVFDAIWFVDDVFTISPKWLQEFHDLIVSNQIKINYECITRADRLSENMLALLKGSGCFRVWIGAESGSQNIIDNMDRRVQVGQVRTMIQEANKQGLQTGTFIMLGYPGETIDDIYETINHLKVANPDYYTLTVAYPIRGTELYNEVQSDFTTTFDWENQSDRDIDFKRMYPKGFYKHAIRLMYNEVQLYKDKLKGRSNLKLMKYKLKSLASRAGMQWYMLKKLA
ncbi:MAG: cobalamin-dependent protein [Bacteroidetes bacterium]|nr:cobalamin-dependent protein [Bacteroidota bacterium]